MSSVGVGGTVVVVAGMVVGGVVVAVERVVVVVAAVSFFLSPESDLPITRPATRRMITTAMPAMMNAAVRFEEGGVGGVCVVGGNGGGGMVAPGAVGGVVA